MTRSSGKIDELAALGAEPVVWDVFDASAVRTAVISFAPDVWMHQLTDLPDRIDQLSEFAPRNDRMRRRNP
jgi:hypothetical protein